MSFFIAPRRRPLLPKLIRNWLGRRALRKYEPIGYITDDGLGETAPPPHTQETE